MKNHVLYILLLAIVFSCTDSHEPLIKTGNIQIALRADDMSEGREMPLVGASSIFITIQDGRQTIIVDKKISLIKLNDDYLTESIALNEGDYTVTRFLVLDDQDNAIYGIPMQGSKFAGQLDQPLPIPFTISENPASLPLTVVSLNSSTAGDIGYTSFQIKYKCALSATVNGQSLCYEDSRYLIAYASAPGQTSVFSLSTALAHTEGNGIQSLNVETTEFTGPGTYTLRRYNGGPEYSTYGSFFILDGSGKQSYYYSESGTLVVDRVIPIKGTSNGLATGTFTMTAKDEKGNTVNVTGSFSDLRGMGWWD
jgi:hypothetical protein